MHRFFNILILLLLGVATPAAQALAPFEDVTEKVGLQLPRTEPEASWVDYDGDGWVDLYANGRLWRNIEGKQFRPVAKVPRRRSFLWGDFDNDGYPDALHHGGFRIFRNTQGRRFVEMDALKHPGSVCVGAALGDFDGNGFLDIYAAGYETPLKPGEHQRYTPDTMFFNTGEGRLVEVWRTPPQHRCRPGRGVAPCDFDEDGDLDIYVSNYRLEPNHLLLNDGRGKFVDVAAQRGVEGEGKTNIDRGHTIGSAWADIDCDGHFDLFVGNFSHPADYQDRPRVFCNLGPAADFRFANRSGKARIKWVESYSTPTFGDYDNDGDPDLFYATVYGGDWGKLYENKGRWAFADVTKQAAIRCEKTYAAAWADYDNDGDLDLFTAARLYRNPGNSNHWLKVCLRGDGKRVARDAIGAQVRIRLGRRVLTRQVESATGQANQNDPTLHFGLGAHRGAVELEIRWPGGARQSVRTETNRRVEIELRDATTENQNIEKGSSTPSGSGAR